MVSFFIFWSVFLFFGLLFLYFYISLLPQFLSSSVPQFPSPSVPYFLISLFPYWIASPKKRNVMVILDLHNQEDFPVILKRSFGITVNNILSDIKIAPDEHKRIYMNFPPHVSYIVIRAYELSTNKLLVINGKFALTLSSADCGCIIKGYIKKYGM